MCLEGRRWVEKYQMKKMEMENDTEDHNADMEGNTMDVVIEEL